MKMPFGLWAQMGLRNRVLDGVQIPRGKGQFWGKGAAEMAELIDLPFGLWTRMGRRKHKFNRWRQCAIPFWAHWRNLTNTVEPSICGGDAV